MTVAVGYAQLSYTGNGATAFPITWPFMLASEIVVALAPVDNPADYQILTIGVDYTVSGGGGAVGTVNFVTAPTSSQRVGIGRYTSPLQIVEWDAYSAFPEKAVENAFDRRALIDQEHASRLETLEATVGANASAVISAADAADSAAAAATDAASAAVSASSAATNQSTTAALAAQVLANIAVSDGVSSDATRILDNISSLFNGSLTSFPLSLSSVAVTPLSAAQLMVHLNGSYQVPGSGYTVSTSNIVFSTAPLAGSSCAVVEIYGVGHSDYTLPVATSSVLGGVKQGSNITIASDGTISAAAGITPTNKANIPVLAGAAGTMLYVPDAPGGAAVVVSDGTYWKILGTLGSVISALNAETDALIARMSVAPSSARKTVIDNLIGALKTAGVWAKLDVLQIYAAHDQQAALLNWIANASNATAVASPSWIADRHFAGNGTSSYIDTGFNPSLSSLSAQNDATLGYWSNASVSALAYTLGIIGTGPFWSMHGRVNAASVYASVNHGSGSPPTFAQTYAQKNIAITRDGASSLKVYARGSQFATDASASGARPNGNYFVGGSDNVPNVTKLYQPNTWPVSAFYYGKALSAGEHAAFDAALSIYMKAAGNWTYPVACWGDSRTLGSSQTPYPNQLQALSTPDRWYYNGGVSGETSTQIRTRMLADTTYVGDWVPIIWAGFNNHSDPTTVLSDIAAMVSRANSSNGGRYLVMTIPGDRDPVDYPGTASRNNLDTINAAILSTYGTRVVDAAALLSAGDPNGVPLAAYVINTVTDFRHYNTAGLAVVAAGVAAKLAALGW